VGQAGATTFYEFIKRLSVTVNSLQGGGETMAEQELHHEIFGSVLDRTEMTPFLLLPARDYASCLGQASKMMANRGFDTLDSDELPESERERAGRYIERAYGYFFDDLFPFAAKQLTTLVRLESPNADLYTDCLGAINRTASVLNDPEFQRLVDEDPRHLFLLASSRKYPHVFSGYPGGTFTVRPDWQQAACALLKMVHLIKSIEEDSQDINDYAQLGFFLEAEGKSLDDLYQYDWEHPAHIPADEPARRAFVKLSAFFHRLRESMSFDRAKGCLVFNSGDGVDVDIAEIKARLKSPESMVTKLAKNVEGEAYDIRDILAITFILQSADDTLKLFHALQKRGVILQENTASHSITQTLYDGPESMREAVRRLLISLARSSGNKDTPEERTVLAHAKEFFQALSMNADQNLHTSRGHRKFQCKIGFSLPLHRAADTNEIMIPGTPLYTMRDRVNKKTEQHTLGVELRISDVESWRTSEQTGESHHDAYKFRQLVFVMNRIFKNVFLLPEESFPQLRKDQAALFS
jgi:uncharacterized protein (TIGR04562 family)